MWTLDLKTNDLVWSQPEVGIAPSALKGNANLQNVNIATAPGQVMASFHRENQAQLAIAGGTLTPDGATLFNAPATLKSGAWISISASTVTDINVTTTPTTLSTDYLVVGGGGAGGSSSSGGGAGGGGGAGEVLAGSSAIAVGNYTITIGAGGKHVNQANGNSGTSSSFASVATAYGGGGGGKNSSNGVAAVTGGSGGGGGNTATGGAGAGTGFAGGNGQDTTEESGGGGGGAGAVGANGLTTDGGNGGVGVSNSITGSAIFYGGGGGGGRDTGSGGSGGNGGGGRANASADGSGTAGTANTGGGGGASAGNFPFVGGAGGSGVIIIAYNTGTAICTGGIVTYTNTKTVHTFTESGTFKVLSLSQTNLYYVSYEDSTDKIKLSTAYDPFGASVVTHGTTGSITFAVVAVPDKPIAKATEKYKTSTSEKYRYYILDDNGRVWVYDTKVYEDTLAANGVGVTWMLPDPVDYTSNKPKGIGILNGWLVLITSSVILVKPTVKLGVAALYMYEGWLTNPYDNHPNFAYTGSQGTLLYTDGNFIGEIFPTTSLVTLVANLQSYASYTASSTFGTIATLIGGSIPVTTDGTRTPVVFFTAEGGTLPTSITRDKVYFLRYNLEGGDFTIHADKTTFSPINIATGATGTQYFNTFYPIGADAGADGTNPLLQLTTQRVNLPFYETATSLLEIGNTVLIGCKGNIVYPWNQVDSLPSDVITLPEEDVVSMLNVNNTAYIFAGDKGNIYITNLVVASLTLKIPDYLAGVPGTANSYIEPSFTWGDAIYVRGRVYCSILDQTATKAGNCGGVFSFIPSENIDPTQEVGMALRLENQNSYGDYDGYAPILITDREQTGKEPKYWAAWQDSYNDATATFGIDYSTENPVTTYVLETDLIPTGTMLQKQTFEQLEYKLAVPLAANESVQLYWRTNPTGAWTSAGTAEVESTYPISGYYRVNFEKTQWVQIRAEVTTTGVASTSTFVPLTEIRLR